MGEEIAHFSRSARNREDVVGEILDHLGSKGIRCSPLLLKNAETAKRIWDDERSYVQSTSGASYGKLKAVFPLLDPDFALQVNLPKPEIQRILDLLGEATYEEVLSHVRLMRHTYDPKSLSLDLDEFYSNLHSTNECLEAAITERDANVLQHFRSRYSPGFIRKVRMLIASIRSEETLRKLDKASKLELDELPPSKADIDNWLLEVMAVLNTLRCGNPSLRRRVRERIGISKIGELSTLMKAASNDEELERFLRGKKLLQRIRHSSDSRNLQPL